MGFLQNFISAAALLLLILAAAAIDGAHANTLVSGTVFCDQCKDGERSLFDYPIYGQIHNLQLNSNYIGSLFILQSWKFIPIYVCILITRN